MQDAMDKVQEFRVKYFGSRRHKKITPTDSRLLREISTALGHWSEMLHDRLYRHPKSIPVLRAHLLVEELGELLLAMSKDDLVEILDGLADLSYVTIGTALDYNLPLAEAFIEVHRSNMTKTRTDDKDVRLRKKGDGYIPPDIKGVLDKCKL